MENFKRFCKEKSITFFFPISIILTIVPLIVRLKTINSDHNKETLELFGAQAQADLFSQNKQTLLIFFSIILIGIFAFCFKKIFEKKDKIINSILILSLVFLGFMFLSSLFSQYKYIAFWGVYDRAEGFITIACYMILFIYSIYTFKTTSDFKCIFIPVMILVAINAFLGLFQYFGADLLKTSLGELISGVNENSLSLTSGNGTLYGTLYHYNYVGSFAAIILPIVIGALFCIDDVFLKLLDLACIACGFWLLLGSTSRAGLVGVGASVLFAIILFRKFVVSHIKPIAITIVCLLAVIIGLNFATGNKILRRVPSLVSDGLSIFKNTSDFDYTTETPIKNIEYINGVSVITLQDETLNISHEDNQFVFKDAENMPIDFTKNVDTKNKIKTLSTTDARFSNITFRLGSYIDKTKDDGLLLYLNNQPAFMFLLQDDNGVHLINGNSKKNIDIEFPETIGFVGKEKLASSRGYIWARTLPLLKDHILLGYGPDTFAFEFPQNDLIGKLYAYNSATEIVDKPHNLYLQMIYSGGLISLLAFLGIILIYVVDSLKLYSAKRRLNELEIMGSVSFLSIIGYLFAGFFNDSIISVAPVFWIVFGTGIAINFMIRKKNKEEK